MKIPYFPFYPDDWIASRTRLELSLTQQGIYILLMAHSWRKPLPTKPEILYRMCPGARHRDIKFVLTKCFLIGDSGYVQKRLAGLRNAADDISSKRSYAAKVHWNKQNGNANAKQMQSKCNTNQNQNQNQNHIKEESKDIRTRTKKQFSPPSIQEIEYYCFEKAINLDAEAFHAWYESNGWKVGKNPMKSWHAAIVTWMKRNGGSMKPKTAQEELLSALKIASNKKMPQLSEPAVTLFYRIGIKWDMLQKKVFYGEDIFSQVPTDRMKIASGEKEDQDATS